MSKQIWLCYIALLGLSGFTSVYAKVGVNASVGVQIGNQKPGYPMANYPQPPPHYPQYPGKPLPPMNQRPPNGNMNGGLSIQYQAPSYTTINQQSYTWVNGDPSVAEIKTIDRVYITNWRELGLPEPPKGMRWIFENGRYVLEAN